MQRPLSSQEFHENLDPNCSFKGGEEIDTVRVKSGEIFSPGSQIQHKLSRYQGLWAPQGCSLGPSVVCQDLARQGYPDGFRNLSWEITETEIILLR